MSKTLPKIVLAAVLKPINDPRMFEKFAQSLLQEHEVHLIGFEATLPQSKHPNLHFYPIFKFNRQAASRWKASKLFLKTLQEIRPNLIIVHAVELLPIACWYSFKTTTPLCYDVRENYWRNIIYQHHYHSLLKLPLAFGVRLLEYASRFIVKRYFLAERNYAKEFWFSRGKQLILENKFQPMPQLKGSKNATTTLQFAYVGTISSVYGTKEAFQLMEQLAETSLVFRFTILGKMANEELGNWFAEQASKYEWFHWQGTAHPVPHQDIIQLMLQSNFVLLPYQTNKSTENCIPTKLYECLALGIPMIIQYNALWKEICQPHQAAIFIDYSNVNTAQLAKQLKNQEFYPKGAVKEAEWREETVELRKVIRTLLGK